MRTARMMLILFVFLFGGVVSRGDETFENSSQRIVVAATPPADATAPAESRLVPLEAPPSGDSPSTAPTTASSDEPAEEPATEGKTPAAPAPEKLLSLEARKLRDNLRRCLAYYFFRPENTDEVSPWGIMHAAVGFGVDTPLIVGEKKVNAIGWLCWNEPCYGMRLFHEDRGLPVAPIGVGRQGHEGQFLQIVGLARVPRSFGMKVDGHEFTIADVIKREQLTCAAGTELSFKLVGLAHYLDTNATWRNQRGEPWSLERMLREEMAQPVIGEACGGTHRLMGLGYAVRRRERQGQPLTGTWDRARRTVENHMAFAFDAQNSDGSFSTRWFTGRGAQADIERRLNTTGHVLEWMLLSLPDDRLNDPRLVRGIAYLTNLMWNYRNQAWEIGPKGHAIHALALYDERVFGGKPGQRQIELAQAGSQTAVR